MTNERTRIPRISDKYEETSALDVYPGQDYMDILSTDSEHANFARSSFAVGLGARYRDTADWMHITAGHDAVNISLLSPGSSIYRTGLRNISVPLGRTAYIGRSDFDSDIVRTSREHVSVRAQKIGRGGG